MELEKDIASIDSKYNEIMISYRELEETHGKRQGALRIVSEDLEIKQQALHLEMRDFEARFEQAKV